MPASIDPIANAVKELQTFTLQNREGMCVSLTNYGATITGIWVPDREGTVENVVLHYPDLPAYQSDPYYVGGTIGRYANRIDRGVLPIGKDVFQLSINEASLQNHLHGGFAGFNKKVWQAVQLTESGEQALRLWYTSPHLDEGYPGTLEVMIGYRLTNQNELIVDYSARSDQPTVVNLTNHSYFNLSGGKRDVLRHMLTVAASQYTPLTDRYLPTGAILPVDGRLFDLRRETELGAVVPSNPTFQYCLEPTEKRSPAAILNDPDSGRRLSVYTTAPGLQVYGGEFLGAPFYPFAGVCLEPQHYPDTPNRPDFPTALLEPGGLYRQTTLYQFDAL